MYAAEGERTLYNGLNVVRPVLERHDMIGNLRARLELLPQQVDLVVNED